MRNKIIIVIMALAFSLAGRQDAVAQTYSGYLKMDDLNGKGPDSLHITITIPEMAHRTRTVYVVDTVYVAQDPAQRKSTRQTRPQRKPSVPSYNAERTQKQKSGYSPRSYYATPWMFGVKTNVLTDLVAIPYAGFEVQLYDHLSLDMNGWFSKWNILYPNDQTRLYGAAPEVRWWFGDEMMRRGHFVGLHGMVAWYTMEWKQKDGTHVIFQNGINDRLDDGSRYPSWSCGVTYGYSLPLDRTGNLGLEFYVGLGYISYRHKRIFPIEDGGSYYYHHAHDQAGITKAGINLTYRFSLRKYRM